MNREFFELERNFLLATQKNLDNNIKVIEVNIINWEKTKELLLSNAKYCQNEIERDWFAKQLKSVTNDLQDLTEAKEDIQWSYLQSTKRLNELNLLLK